MDLYDKLVQKYQKKHLSLSTTQTTIEETDTDAVTKNATIEHSGTEVLKVSKDLLSEIRDAIGGKAVEVCDGIAATSTHIGYFELKSMCSTTNVLKARSQILDSQCHWQEIAKTCSVDMSNYIEKGIIVTQPITDENRRKAQQRCKRDDDLNNAVSSARFLLKLLAGKAVANEAGMPLLHFNAGETIPLEKIFF